MNPVDGQLSDEQVVKQIYTDATLVLNVDKNYYIYSRQGAGGRLSAYCATKEGAWESAKTKHIANPEAQCYCGLEPVHKVSSHKIHPAYNPELDGDDPASMEGSYRPEFSSARAKLEVKAEPSDGDPLPSWIGNILTEKLGKAEPPTSNVGLPAIPKFRPEWDGDEAGFELTYRRDQILSLQSQLQEARAEIQRLREGK